MWILPSMKSWHICWQITYYYYYYYSPPLWHTSIFLLNLIYFFTEQFLYHLSMNYFIIHAKFHMAAILCFHIQSALDCFLSLHIMLYDIILSTMLSIRTTGYATRCLNLNSKHINVYCIKYLSACDCGYDLWQFNLHCYSILDRAYMLTMLWS